MGSERRRVLTAIAGPETLSLRAAVDTQGVGLTTSADFVVGPDDRLPFVLVWHPSHVPVPPAD
jgi:hypothetical protein